MDATTIANIVTASAFILSLISFITTKNQAKKDNDNASITMTANYFSYPTITNKDNCIIRIPIDSISIVSGYVDNNNILFEDGIEKKDGYSFKVSFALNNKTNIYPTEVLIRKMELIFKSEKFGNENILKEFLFFHSYDQKYKPSYIDNNENITFDVICFISMDTKEKLENYLENDEMVHLSFDYSFKNPFDVFTDGNYKTIIKRDKVTNKRNDKIIGSQEKTIEYKPYKSLLLNTNIKYKPENKKVKEKKQSEYRKIRRG